MLRFVKFDELRPKMVVAAVGYDHNNWSLPDPRGWSSEVYCVKDVIAGETKRVSLMHFSGEFQGFEVFLNDEKKIQVWDLFDHGSMCFVLLQEECPERLPVHYSVSSGMGGSNIISSALVGMPEWSFPGGPIGPKKGENVENVPYAESLEEDTSSDGLEEE